ncbi:MAG TPA: zf-TFIIB domain-containing protein [Candidatus Saccharimonadales bacterium]|nr:zf-TFIIB domain-containing protein [Candidatus Saccharimonadales bacterium]
MADSADESAILSFYTAGHMLARADRGEIEGMRYATYVTMLDAFTPKQFVDDMAVIHVLDLPFNTSTHLVGLSKQHKIDRLRFGEFLKSGGMESVVLEGDFRNYFDLYAAQDQQLEVREVLDPAAMAYVVDYCKTHFWEINRSELYIVASIADKDGGDIFKEALEFVGQIKPALRPGDPGAPVVHHEIPYGEYDGPALKCPVCSKEMASNNLWFGCPDGHGILISGRELLGLRNHTIHLDVDTSKSENHGQITCPNCHNKMEEISYDDDENLKIDSCTHCPYRWLDAKDITQIMNHDESKNKLDDILGKPPDELREQL